MAFSLSVWLLVFTSGTSMLALYNPNVFHALKFNPWIIRERRQWYRFITSAFVHAGFVHLALNMYVLYLFGPFVEGQFILMEGGDILIGRLIFGLFYLTACVFSAAHSYEKHRHNPSYSAVGASGAIAAVVFAFIAMRPAAPLGVVLIPYLRLPAFVMGVLYLIYSWQMARLGRDNIGHDVHFYGALYGLLFMFIYRPSLFRDFLDQLTFLPSLGTAF
jgi:membrane associated rhomboid family serine protease